MKINKENYEKLKKFSDDIMYDDKEQYSVKDWLDCYGANIRSELDENGYYVGTVTFGSAYAFTKLLRRHEKQIVRNVLKLLKEG